MKQCTGRGGVGAEPKQEVKRLGPLHAYPGMKRDAMITVGLIALLLVLRLFGS